MIGIIVAMLLPALAGYGLLRLHRRQQRLKGRGLSAFFLGFMFLVLLLYLCLCFLNYFLGASRKWIA
jgi:hypothetical protein